MENIYSPALKEVLNYLKKLYLICWF